MDKPDFVTDEHLKYLDVLRTTGNMSTFEAGIYLRREFELSSDEARAILIYWMKTSRHKED